MRNQDETPPVTQCVDQTRRRLTKAGLAAPAVLGVLASRPVLGQTIQSLHNCTPSGHISGFASPNPNGTICSDLGLPPSSYLDPATWPAGFKDSEGKPLPFNQAPTTSNTKFIGNILTISDNPYVIKNPGQAAPIRIATVEEVLKGEHIPANASETSPNIYLAVSAGFTGSPDDFTLGKEAIVACMNANRDEGAGYPNHFPISDDQVVNMFNNVIKGGEDPVTSTATWDAAEVIAYFQSLHTQAPL